MATAAAEPTVPGAHRDRPQPNQVAMAKATLLRGELVMPVHAIPPPRGKPLPDGRGSDGSVCYRSRDR